MSTLAENAQIINQELNWLQTIINHRVNNFIHQNDPNVLEQAPNPPTPDVSQLSTYYTDFIQTHALTPDERKVILLALAPEIQPELLDCFLIRSQTYDKTYTEFGGIATRSFNGFIPTVKTALFVLGGHQVGEQMTYISLFDKPANYTPPIFLKNCAPKKTALPPTGSSL